VVTEIACSNIFPCKARKFSKLQKIARLYWKLLAVLPFYNGITRTHVGLNELNFNLIKVEIVATDANLR